MKKKTLERQFRTLVRERLATLPLEQQRAVAEAALARGRGGDSRDLLKVIREHEAAPAPVAAPTAPPAPEAPHLAEYQRLREQNRVFAAHYQHTNQRAIEAERRAVAKMQAPPTGPSTTPTLDQYRELRTTKPMIAAYFAREHRVALDREYAALELGPEILDDLK